MESQRYHIFGMAVFFVFFSLLLFTVVEMRRAFLFPLDGYLKVGFPSPILYLDPRHLPLLLAGGLGTWLAWRYMVKLEKGLKEKGVGFKATTTILAIGIMVLLIVDLFIYRGVPASRIAIAGRLGIGYAFPISYFSGWLRPLGEGINYLALVWHATIIGILLGALFLLLLPLFLKPLLGGSGFRSHIAGAALAIPQPFCSCCAAPIGATLYRGGASLGPTLAFVVSSPMLNVTTLILATVLLPPKFALLRILGGVIVGVFITYLVSLIASRWAVPSGVQARPKKLSQFSLRVLEGYGRLFHFEGFLKERTVDSPGAFISNWLALAWRLGRVVVPVLFVGSLVAVTIVMALPSPRNDTLGVIVAAVFGTILMIPTWTEIAIAGAFIKEGLNGPAASLLLTLPAVSIPCLLVIGSALQNSRVALLLGLMVFIVGILAGLIFFL